MSLAEARQGRGRGRELEAEARQTKFEARPRRGDPLKNPPSPRCIAVPNLVALSQTVRQRVNGLVAPPSLVEVIYVIPLYGVSRGLNLNLSSVGGRSLKLTDYYRAEPRPRQKL